MNETTPAMQILNQIPWEQATVTINRVKTHPEVVGHINILWREPDTTHEVNIMRKVYRVVKNDPDLGPSWEWVKVYTILNYPEDEIPLTDEEYHWVMKQTDKCK